MFVFCCRCKKLSESAISQHGSKQTQWHVASKTSPSIHPSCPPWSCYFNGSAFHFVHATMCPVVFDSLPPGNCLAATTTLPCPINLSCMASHSHGQTTFSLPDRPEFIDDSCQYSWCNKTVSLFSAIFFS